MKKIDFKTMHLSDIPGVIKSIFTGEDDNEMMTGQTGKYEINLVPDIKTDMLKLMKLRNMIVFGCVVVIIASSVFTAFLAIFKGAQDLTIASQGKHIENLSNTINQYSELPDFLNIQDQLAKLKSINDNRSVLSRVFPVLKNLFPTNKDTIKISDLNVNLSTSTINFDAQANAGEEPYIDYRVLESFKKSVNLMKYDYGRYVDAQGNLIPSRCIEETDAAGNILTDNGNTYAIWKRGLTDCDPSRNDHQKKSALTQSNNNSNVSNTNLKSDFGKVKAKSNVSDDVEHVENTEKSGNVENNGDVVKTDIQTIIPDEKIWRSPLFDLWYKHEKMRTADDGIQDTLDTNAEVSESEVNGVKTRTQKIKNVKNYIYTPSMGLDGKISSVPHFESSCITYKGEKNGDSVKWSAENKCKMVPNGIRVTDSSNGRDSSSNLVLRFSTIINVDPELFKFTNKHILTFGPSGQNVTDSYLQVEGMFAAPAKDCAKDDAECVGQKTSAGTNN